AGPTRRAGGAGSGLAISREFPTLLGAEIQLRSSAGVGSTFTLYLPLKYAGPTSGVRLPTANAIQAPAPVIVPALGTVERPVETIPDDRHEIQPGDNILLVIQDDPDNAQGIMDLSRDKGFKVLLAMRGGDALDLAKQYQPSAVSLDVFLPDILGWTVLSQLK